MDPYLCGRLINLHFLDHTMCNLVSITPMSQVENLSHKLCDLKLENSSFDCLSQPLSLAYSREHSSKASITQKLKTKNTREYEDVRKLILLLKSL